MEDPLNGLVCSMTIKYHALLAFSNHQHQKQQQTHGGGYCCYNARNNNTSDTNTDWTKGSIQLLM